MNREQEATPAICRQLKSNKLGPTALIADLSHAPRAQADGQAVLSQLDVLLYSKTTIHVAHKHTLHLSTFIHARAVTVVLLFAAGDPQGEIAAAGRTQSVRSHTHTHASYCV